MPTSEGFRGVLRRNLRGFAGSVQLDEYRLGVRLLGVRDGAVDVAHSPSFWRREATKVVDIPAMGRRIVGAKTEIRD